MVIIAAGRLVRHGPVAEVMASMSGAAMVRVRTPHGDRLTPALTSAGATVTAAPDGALLVTGVEAPVVGRTALAEGVELHELSTERPDLERVFLELTSAKAAIR